jgi:hypothetical protein
MQSKQMGISKIWMEMEQKIKGFIQGGNKGKVLYLQVPAGVGKSHITTKAINDLFPVGKGDVTWFGSMHDQFNDLGNLRASNWVHVMGRQGCNCKYAKEAKILYGRGISIPDNLCGKRCGGGCDYWKQLKQPGHKFLPHQMLFFFDGKKTPLVVFDELDVKVFLQPYSVDANELVRLARAEHKDLWDAFYKLMTENKEFSGIELYNGLINKMNLPDFPALKKLLTTIKFTDAKIDDLFKAQDLPMFGVGETLLKVMSAELEAIINANSPFNPRLHINPIKKDNKQVKFEIIIRNEPPIWLKDKPIILLGAKGDQTLFEKVLGKKNSDFIPYSPKVSLPKEVEVVKEQKESLPRISIKKPLNKVLVSDKIKEHVDSALKTCLISFMDCEGDFATSLGLQKTKYDVVGKLQGKYADSGHYWAVRGLNAWKDYEQIIIIGTPTPNLDDMERQVEALFWDDKQLDKTRANNDYIDPRLSAYLHSLREDELYQAVFRIRPLTLNGRAKIKIIVASSISLPDLDSNVTANLDIKFKWEINSKDTETKIETAINELLKTKGKFSVKELAGQLNGFSGISERTLYRYLKESFLAKVNVEKNPHDHTFRSKNQLSATACQTN